MIEDSKRTFKEKIIPYTNLLTPNRLEAEELVGYPLLTENDIERAGNDLLQLMKRTFVVFNQQRERPVKNVGRTMDVFRKLYRRDNISHMTYGFMIDRVRGFMDMHIEHTDYRRGYG